MGSTSYTETGEAQAFAVNEPLRLVCPLEPCKRVFTFRFLTEEEYRRLFWHNKRMRLRRFLVGCAVTALGLFLLNGTGGQDPAITGIAEITGFVILVPAEITSFVLLLVLIFKRTAPFSLVPEVAEPVDYKGPYPTHSAKLV